MAYDGEAGIVEVLACRPDDLVFVDIGMPGIDGYERAGAFERMGPDVIVVALTGWGRVRDKQAAAMAGFDVHLTKPADRAPSKSADRPDPRTRF